MDILSGLNILLALLDSTQKVASIIHNMQTQGRDKFTPEEWALILQENSKARASLVTEIKNKQGT